MAVVPIRKDVTPESIFDAVTELVGTLNHKEHAQAIEALLAVSHSIMVDGLSYSSRFRIDPTAKARRGRPVL
jgi:hypothetical protein